MQRSIIRSSTRRRQVAALVAVSAAFVGTVTLTRGHTAEAHPLAPVAAPHATAPVGHPAPPSADALAAWWKQWWEAQAKRHGHDEPRVPTAHVTLSNGKIVMDDAIHAGPVKVHADNVGTVEHEVVFVAAKDAARLPTNPDGSVDEDKIPESAKVGEIADLVAGASGEATFTFPRGSYVAFCNIVDGDHVHFKAGMYTTFTVR